MHAYSNCRTVPGVDADDGESPDDTTGQVRRVVILDDHPAILDALAATIDRQPDMEVCGMASSTEEALRLIERTSPDVATLDVSLHDAPGLDLIQSLRTKYPALRIVVFSMYDERVYAERALRAGASGYVMKSEPTRTVAEAIRCVAQDDVFLSPRVASRMLSKLAPGNAGNASGLATDALTDREMEVFQMLGQGASVRHIADQLNLSRKTVETYRRRAKEKLGFESMTQLLQFAVQWTYGQSGNRPA